MGSAPENIESEEPLQQVSCIGCSGDPKTGGEPEPHCHCKRLAVALTGVFVAFITVLAVLTPKLPSADLCPPACPDGWIGYRGKCYYFSEAEGNWSYSQSHCSAPGASLAGIDSGQEMVFLLRYKGVHEHWIGLRREQGQPWKWTNGTEFNHPFQVLGSTAGNSCGMLRGSRIQSETCDAELKWICRKEAVVI